MQGKSFVAASSLPAVAEATAQPVTDRLPWPHAGRVVAGLSLLGWAAILVLILPVIG
jgi:hypothetical protein